MANQALHVALMKDITHQAVILAQKQPAIMASHNTGSILAAVLEDGKRVIQRLIDVRLTDDTDDATHVTQPLLVVQANSGRERRCSRPYTTHQLGELRPLASH
jgi:hypothetical protein